MPTIVTATGPRVQPHRTVIRDAHTEAGRG